MIDNSELKDPFEQIELSDKSTCHIQIERNGSQMCQVSLSIADNKNRVTTFQIKTSKEFLCSAGMTISRVADCIVGPVTSNGNIKTKVKVKKGMCKVTGYIQRGTKIKHSFPVDDYYSWGKATLCIKDWDEFIRIMSFM